MRLIVVLLVLALALGEGSSKRVNDHTKENLHKVFEPRGIENFCNDFYDRDDDEEFLSEEFIDLEEKSESIPIKLMRFVSYDNHIYPQTYEI